MIIPNNGDKEGDNTMTMLKVSRLKKEYDKGKGILDFNLSMKDKDIVLLLGPNGAGKTTAIRGILGLTTIDAGSIVFNDKDTTNAPTELLKSVGACVSTPAYYEYMSGYNNLKLYSEFYDNVDNDRILEVLDIVELAEEKDKKVAKYSTGMKQRLDFARAILHNPDLLILDEPFGGMDIEKKANLKGYLTGLTEYNNTSILISSHMVGDLEKFANRVIILYEGKCLYEGTTKAALEEHDGLEEFYLDVIRRYKEEIVSTVSVGGGR